MTMEKQITSKPVGGTRRAPLIIKDTWRMEERFQSAISGRFTAQWEGNGGSGLSVFCPAAEQKKIATRETDTLRKLGAFPHRKYAKTVTFQLTRGTSAAWRQRFRKWKMCNARWAPSNAWFAASLSKLSGKNYVVLSVCVLVGPSSSIWSL